MPYRKTRNHLGKDALVALLRPAVVGYLMRTICRGDIAPTSAIAIEGDNAAQDPSIIHSRLAMGLGEEMLRTRQLRIPQPEKIRHAQHSAVEA